MGWDSIVGEVTHCGLAAWGLNPVGGKIFCTHPDWPWFPPSLIYSGYWIFPRGKAARAWC